MRKTGYLSSAACQANDSLGRRFAEPPAPTRSVFQRDRDRIVHSTAFRRLVYKTQVFLNHEGDLFRTRLTHSLEVAQLGRSIARALRLDEDLVEGIALAHDLGHTPFGHAGQDALNLCMQGHGGFEHNLQSLRVVDWLEQRYPAFDGLNLTFETREGILKHCSAANAKRLEAAEPGGVGQRFLRGRQPSLEAQLCNLADEIAYNAHDIDDGVRSGLLDLEQLQEVGLFDTFRREALAEYPALGGRRLLHEAIRRMLSAQVYNVIDTTRAALDLARPLSVHEVRALPALVSFSTPMREQSTELKRFLHRNLYRHPQVLQNTTQAQQVVRELFAAYCDEPAQMQPDFAAREDRARGGRLHRGHDGPLRSARARAPERPETACVNALLTAPPPGARGVPPAFVVVLAGVGAALHIGKLPPALPVLRDALGLSLVQAGFLLSIVQFAGMALGIFVGLAADTLGLRRSMLIGLVVLSLAGIAGGFATDAAQLLGLRAVEGFGFLLAVMPAPGLLRALVTGARLNGMLGLWGAYMPLGTALALLCGPPLLAHLGWPAWWWLIATLSLLLAGWGWRAVPADAARARPAPAAAASTWRARLRSTLRSRGPWLVALCFAVYSAQWIALIGFLPSIYTAAGVGSTATGVLTALAAAVNMVGNIAAGRLLQRGVPPQWLLWSGFAAMAIGAVATFAQFGGAAFPPALRYAGVLLFSTLGGLIPGTLFALAVQRAPSVDTVSTTVGWMQQWSAIGQFAGPPLVAWLAASSGGWQWTWVATGGCALLGMLLAAALARPPLSART